MVQLKAQFRTRTLDLNLDPTGTVQDAKSVISPLVDVPSNYLRIVFRGRERQDAETLASFGLDKPLSRFSVIEKAEYERLRPKDAAGTPHATPQAEPISAPPARMPPPDLPPAERAAVTRIDGVVGEAEALAAAAREGALDRAWRLQLERTLLQLERLIEKLDLIEMDAFPRESFPRAHRRQAVLTIQGLMQALDQQLAAAGASAH